MAIGVNKRASAVYFKHEVTPGTSVAPSSATDAYFAVSQDFATSYDKEILESDLITSSIGRRKGQLGLQDTGGECSVEFKHSGVEGQAPEFDNVLETLFGTKAEAATEYDLVAGSTTTALNLDTGEGANFAKGSAVLVKDATNGYSIRPVSDVTGDVLTVAPALAFAPAATTLTGKAVKFSPANSGHKHGTLGVYWGNAVTEKVAGCLVESLALEITTGQIIKGAFGFKGLNNARTLAASPFTPTYDTSSGLVGLDVEAYIDTVKIDFSTCTVNINDEVAELLSAKEVSGKVSSRPRARTVDISLTTYIDDASLANQTKFNALTDFAFTLIAGKKSGGNYVAGQCWCLYVPSCYFTAAPFGDEDDILTEELTFAAHIGNGDEVFLNFL